MQMDYAPLKKEGFLGNLNTTSHTVNLVGIFDCECNNSGAPVILLPPTYQLVHPKRHLFLQCVTLCIASKCHTNRILNFGDKLSVRHTIAGFQSESKRIRRLAPMRLMPAPPARVESKKICAQSSVSSVLSYSQNIG